MPELPDLEAIRAVLNRKVQGAVVESVRVKLPLLIRYPTAALFESELLGARIGSTGRRGKFLLTEIGEGRTLALNPMLTGRLHLLEANGRKGGRVGFDDGRTLRYTDQKLMGKVYLVPRNHLDLIPTVSGYGSRRAGAGDENRRVSRAPAPVQRPDQERFSKRRVHRGHRQRVRGRDLVRGGNSSVSKAGQPKRARSRRALFEHASSALGGDQDRRGSDGRRHRNKDQRFSRRPR